MVIHLICVLKQTGRYLLLATIVLIQSCNDKPVSTEGMVWIDGGEFVMGTNDEGVYHHERPAHRVTVSGFWMDATEVTNAQFQSFIEFTGYVTVAERKPDWENIKAQLPLGTPKPHDSVLVAGSLTFTPPGKTVLLNDYSQWWSWTIGANWKNPEGNQSTIDQKWNHPVVHIAHEDAARYCAAQGKRLPTEAEWEFASRGGDPAKPFDYSTDLAPQQKFIANVYQGSFPNVNLAQDGFPGTAPVRSFPPNKYGLYDMIGNVWELTSDLYHVDYYKVLAEEGVVENPYGPKSSFDPNEPGVKKYVSKGGSYLCSFDYCSNYRPTGRQATAFDSGQSHIGFRCAR